MLTKDSNTEVYNILNNAIKDMKADGTLDSLIANELNAYINSDLEPKDLPHFDGARTIKIGVTGDIPPMDFVAANGKAAGFNIALLTEIANCAQVNIELVQIETGARAMVLSTDKVDAVFWSMVDIQYLRYGNQRIQLRKNCFYFRKMSGLLPYSVVLCCADRKGGTAYE